MICWYVGMLVCWYVGTLVTRYNGKMDYLQEQRFTTNFGERSFSVSASKLWNKLPQKIRDIYILAHFKTALKAHYCIKAYLKRNASWNEV